VLVTLPLVDEGAADEDKDWQVRLTPNTVEPIPTLGALLPRGKPVQDPVLTPPCQRLFPSLLIDNSQAWSCVKQTSMGLKYEPSLEPLHIYVEQLFLN